MDNQRNLLLAVALSFLLILGWDAAMRYVYPEASLMGSPDTEEQAAADGTAPVAVTAAGSAFVNPGISDIVTMHMECTVDAR